MKVNAANGFVEISHQVKATDWQSGYPCFQTQTFVFTPNQASELCRLLPDAIATAEVQNSDWRASRIKQLEDELSVLKRVK